MYPSTNMDGSIETTNYFACTIKEMLSKIKVEWHCSKIHWQNFSNTYEHQIGHILSKKSHRILENFEMLSSWNNFLLTHILCLFLVSVWYFASFFFRFVTPSTNLHGSIHRTYKCFYSHNKGDDVKKCKWNSITHKSTDKIFLIPMNT